MNMNEDKLKIAAFDALVSQLQGKHKIHKIFYIPYIKSNKLPDGNIEYTPYSKKSIEYSWNLHAVDTTDIKGVLLNLGLDALEQQERAEQQKLILQIADTLVKK